MTTPPLIEVEGLRKLFPVGGGFLRRAQGHVHAVDGLDFTLERGESLGLVGESGCGKSTTARVLTRLAAPTDGRVLLQSAKDEHEVLDVAHLDRDAKRRFRRRVQMIFQDPYESMNPRRTVLDTIAEPLRVQGIGTPSDREDAAGAMLEQVGLSPASSFLYRFPHELSGGQRQRVAIARALVVEPDLVVADEPTSMLDVSIRISVMELMLKLAEDMDVSYLYITHDLAVARYMCHRIAVMYLGKIVEIAPTETLLADPKHPYTQALLSAVPVPDPTVTRPEVDIRGGISKPLDPEPTCRFLDRCPWGDDVCRTYEHPPLERFGEDHYVACYHAG